MDSKGAQTQGKVSYWRYDLVEMRRSTAALEGLRVVVGKVNPRLPGWRNVPIQLVKGFVAWLLRWYTRPLREFQACVTRSLEEIASNVEHLAMDIHALDHLSANLTAFESRLAMAESVERQVEELRARLETLTGASRTAHLETLAWPAVNGRAAAIREPSGRPKTIYLIGLFGTGRHYVDHLLMRNLENQGRYVRDSIRLHPGPTRMIYSGHATRKYVCRAQAAPDVMNRILDSVAAGFADIIFVYRHPLDSLLTNWVWWRTYLRDKVRVEGITAIYENVDDLCAELDRHFSEFQSFAEGDPAFFDADPGPPFLSFPEFVEETELHLGCATLALRLEDAIADPRREFLRIIDRMSQDVDLDSLYLEPPRTKPFRYLSVKEKVPRFRSYINALDAETKRRIEKIGYGL